METGAVADARRHRDHGCFHQPADDAGQRPFHSGGDDDHLGFTQAPGVGEQPVDAGDADVENRLDTRPHDRGGHRGFPGYRYVRGSGRHHQDEPLFRQRFEPGRADHHGASRSIDLGVVEAIGHCPPEIAVDPRRQDHRLLCQDTGGYFHNLVNGLSLAEDGFRKAPAKSSVVIDVGEPADLLEWKVLQPRQRFPGA